jgi:hypothetical protein
MDGTIARGLGAAIISFIIIAIVIVSALWMTAGYFVGKSKYRHGYLQGQLDCQKGINNIKVQTDTTYKLK